MQASHLREIFLYELSVSMPPFPQTNRQPKSPNPSSATRFSLITTLTSVSANTTFFSFFLIIAKKKKDDWACITPNKIAWRWIYLIRRERSKTHPTGLYWSQMIIIILFYFLLFLKKTWTYLLFGENTSQRLRAFFFFLLFLELILN